MKFYAYAADEHTLNILQTLVFSILQANVHPSRLYGSLFKRFHTNYFLFTLSHLESFLFAVGSPFPCAAEMVPSSSLSPASTSSWLKRSAARII